MLLLARYLITLPLLAAPLWSLGLKPAAAEPASALEAVAILSEARAADAKCRHLSEAEHQELADYAAQAEIMGVARVSAGAAEAAVTAGKAKGQAALCDAETVEAIRSTLAAAQAAMATARRLAVAEPLERPVARWPAAKSEDRRAIVAPVPRPPALARYAARVTAYYAERRCRHLPHEDAKRFWIEIVRELRAALAAHGRRAVSSIMRRAEADAAALPCGVETASLVKARYAERAMQ